MRDIDPLHWQGKIIITSLQVVILVIKEHCLFKLEDALQCKTYAHMNTPPFKVRSQIAQVLHTHTHTHTHTRTHTHRHTHTQHFNQLKPDINLECLFRSYNAAEKGEIDE